MLVNDDAETPHRSKRARVDANAVVVADGNAVVVADGNAVVVADADAGADTDNT